MADRSIPPRIQPLTLFAIPTPHKEEILNGIPVYYFDNPNLDLIHILLQVNAGSLHQDRKHVCNFTYSLLRESSPRHAPEETASLLDYYGTNVTVNAGMARVQIMISVPKSKMADILPEIADFLIFPQFRQDK